MKKKILQLHYQVFGPGGTSVSLGTVLVPTFEDKGDPPGPYIVSARIDAVRYDEEAKPRPRKKAKTMSLPRKKAPR